jgi:hypothetical protein
MIFVKHFFFFYLSISVLSFFPLALHGGLFTFNSRGSTIKIGKTSELKVSNNSGTKTYNGTILKEDGGKISGSSFFFDNGIYSNDDFASIFTGIWDPNLTTSIKLQGGMLFNQIDPGKIGEEIRVTFTNNRLEGLTSFINPNSVVLQNSAAELFIAIQSELNQNLVLNGGTIFLDSSLALGDGITFLGNGRVNFQANNLILGTKDTVWTGSLLLNAAKNIELSGGKTRVTGVWHFNHDAQIIGNNSVLDLTHCGTLWIKRNTGVRMTNLTLRGLGQGGGTILFEDHTSTLSLFNVIVDMANNLTITEGNWYVEGPVKVLTRDKFLTFDLRGTLTVNGETLFYDPLSFNDTNNVRFGSIDVNLARIDGGSVQKNRSLQVGDFILTGNTKLDRSLVASSLKKLRVQSDSVVDGDGFAFNFARNPGESIFIIDANKQVRFKNILLLDFPVKNSTYGSDSTIIFGGSSTTVELGENGTLTTTWFFDGSSVLNGSNKILQLGTGGSIVLRPQTSLLLDNITIRGIKDNNIRCMDNNCTLSLGNVDWKQTGNYSFTNSRLEVIGAFTLIGTSTFEYATNRQSLITSFGTMCVDQEMSFSYAPPIDNRDLLAMENNSAVFCLNNATLASTTTGFRLTNGSIVITGQNFLFNDNAIADSEAISLGNGQISNDVFIKIQAGARLNIMSGKLFYDNVVS